MIRPKKLLVRDFLGVLSWGLGHMTALDISGEGESWAF